MRALLVFVAIACLGCETRAQTTSPVASAAGSATTTTATATARPYALHLPAGRDHAKPAPVVVFLHGYGAPGGALGARQLGLEAFADDAGFVLAAPDGTLDGRGNRFWNATDACCNFDHSPVDDVAYIAWLLDDVAARVAVDPRRVFVMGHSNGGFFAHRLACDLAPRVAAAVSVAGAAWKDGARCAPGGPVSVLQIHGDADAIIHIDGGHVFDLPVPAYPAARDTVAGWARRDACTGGLVATGQQLDFDATVPGAETSVSAYAGCPAGVAVELWTMAGGSHVPAPTRAGLDAIWAWMGAHAKP
ncbi:MAG TPA: PHB depolymerase family esterase [Polyangiaceae bacterium]